MSTQFTITFVPQKDVDAIKAIRRLLKHAGRYLGLHAIDVREGHDTAAGGVTNTEPAATVQQSDDHLHRPF
jgi:hypothetical protein